MRRVRHKPPNRPLWYDRPIHFFPLPDNNALFDLHLQHRSCLISRSTYHDTQQEKETHARLIPVAVPLTPIALAAMDIASIEAACAICHDRRISPEGCRCEVDALRIAVQNAFEDFLRSSPRLEQARSVDLEPSRRKSTAQSISSLSLTLHRLWVTAAAKNRVADDFDHFKAEALRVYHCTVSSIPCYEMYVRYRGRPPMNEQRIAGIAYQIRAAEREYLDTIDGAWSRCVLQYPFWLHHFWTMVRFVPPSPAAPSDEERAMVSRGRGESRRRSRRDSVLADGGRRRYSEYDTDVRYLDM